MSSVGSKGVIIQDALGGDAVTVTDGKLDVNATLSANVTVALDSNEDSVECIQDTASDLNATIGNAIDNAVYTRITDGSGVAAVNGNNQLEVEVKNSSLTVDLGTDNDVTVTGTVGHDITGMTHAVQVVGTDAVNLSSASCKRIDLMGNPANTGDIYIGSSDAIADNGGVGGIRLQAGDFYSIDIDDTDEIYAEASEASQILNYIYFT